MTNAITIKLFGVLIAIATLFTTSSFATEELIKAIQNQDFETVKLEIENGADPNYARKNSFTALGLAALKGNAEIVSLLIKAGADVDQKVRPYSEDTPLATAAQSSADAIQVINILIKAGAQTELKSGEWVMTPLRLAIMNRRTEHALTLIANKVDLVAKDKEGDPALHAAIYQQNEIVLRALLDQKVDPTFVNHSGENAVQFAKKWNRDAFTLPILSEYYPDFCTTNPCDKNN